MAESNSARWAAQRSKTDPYWLLLTLTGYVIVRDAVTTAYNPHTEITPIEPPVTFYKISLPAAFEYVTSIGTWAIMQESDKTYPVTAAISCFQHLHIATLTVLYSAVLVLKTARLAILETVPKSWILLIHVFSMANAMFTSKKILFITFIFSFQICFDVSLLFLLFTYSYLGCIRYYSNNNNNIWYL